MKYDNPLEWTAPMTTPCDRRLDDALVYTIAQYDALAADLAQYKAWAEPQVITHGADQLRIRDLEAELAISKGREEAKQLVITQLEAELAGYKESHEKYCQSAVRVRELEASLRAVMAASFSQDSTYKIAERALPQSETTPEQIPCSCGSGDCNQRILAHNEYCTEDRERAGLAQSDRSAK